MNYIMLASLFVVLVLMLVVAFVAEKRLAKQVDGEASQREIVRLEIANRAMAQALRDAVYALESVVDPYLYPPYAPKRMCEVWEQIPVVRNVVWNVKFSCAEALARAAGVLGGDPLRRLDMEPVAAEGERRVPRG